MSDTDLLEAIIANGWSVTPATTRCIRWKVGSNDGSEGYYGYGLTLREAVVNAIRAKG